MARKEFVLLLLSCFIGFSEQCMCLPKHPQQAFCSSKYVVRARVLSDKKQSLSKYHEMLKGMGLDPYERYYDIEVLETFKNDELKPLNETKDTEVTEDGTYVAKLFVTGSSISCALDLEKHKEYLLTLRHQSGQLKIGLCDWKSDWETVYNTEKLFYGFAGLYQCKCRVTTCVNGYCDGDTACKWKVVPHVFKKKEEYDICIASSNGCRWMVTDGFSDNDLP